jgi:hypothetical protein
MAAEPMATRILPSRGVPFFGFGHMMYQLDVNQNAATHL